MKHTLVNSTFKFFSVLLLILCGCASSPEKSNVEIAKKYLQKSGVIFGSYKDSDVTSVYDALTIIDHLKLRPETNHETAFSIFFKSSDLSVINKYIQSHTKAWSFDPEILNTIQSMDRQLNIKHDSEIDAANIGLMLWLLGTEKPELQTTISKQTNLNFQEVKNGVIFINPNMISNRSETKLIEDIQMLSTLAHEATHSACEKSDKLPIKFDKSSKSELANFDKCFSVHVECKNSNSKILGCDSGPWGAYTVNYLVFSEIAQRCTMCSLPILYLKSFEAILKVNSLPKKIEDDIHEIFNEIVPGITAKERGEIMFKIGYTNEKIQHYLKSNLP